MRKIIVTRGQEGLLVEKPFPQPLRIRAFISVDIEPTQDLVGLLGELRRSRADLKIVRPELLHLTLKFLGDTEEDLVGEICSRMGRVSEETTPFSIRLTGLGAFPSVSNIRVVWIGVHDGQLLTVIAEHLDIALGGIGFERDRKGFKPHLTIARTRSSGDIGRLQNMIREKAATQYGSYRIDRIRLKKSVLGPDGPTYHTIGEFALGVHG
ncbi:MAG: RNA 2',3'-cyclic phosphodiesterase [Candidatus Thermoplasmatota archaeon]|nr:RNA 2',3'-cyclic phosphodiesterase [Candidatus Thermoplasmatota archaeon]